jgi:hypothetical protein
MLFFSSSFPSFFFVEVGTLTSKLADVDVKSKLLVAQIEELVVFILLVHEVDSGTDIAASFELQAQRAARCLDTVSTRVVGTIESAVRGTGDSVRAESLVPGVASVAVGRSRSGVEPAPVTVKDDALGLRSATAGRASRDGERRVLLGSKCTGLLSLYNRAQGEGGKGEGEGRHAGRLERGCSTAGFVGCGVKLSETSRMTTFIWSTDISIPAQDCYSVASSMSSASRDRIIERSRSSWIHSLPSLCGPSVRKPTERRPQRATPCMLFV